MTNKKSFLDGMPSTLAYVIGAGLVAAAFVSALLSVADRDARFFSDCIAHGVLEQICQKMITG